MHVHAVLSRSLLLATLLLPALALQAQPVADDDAIESIRALFDRTQPDMKIQTIEPSPIEGVYQVTTRSLQHIYVTEDAGFLISGDLYENSPQGLVNRSEEQRFDERIERLAEVPESEMIIFEADEETRATLTVFTDLDCPYCRQLHGDLDELNAMGIRVRYLAFPRKGMGNETAVKMRSTWCSENPRAMLTSAKRGGDVPPAQCDDPVEKHYRLGQELGVQGTPALVLEDGYIFNGYVPADQLGRYLLGPMEP